MRKSIRSIIIPAALVALLAGATLSGRAAAGANQRNHWGTCNTIEPRDPDAETYVRVDVLNSKGCKSAMQMAQATGDVDDVEGRYGGWRVKEKKVVNPDGLLSWRWEKGKGRNKLVAKMVTAWYEYACDGDTPYEGDDGYCYASEDGLLRQ